jgi:hypothetical protein
LLPLLLSCQSLKNPAQKIEISYEYLDIDVPVFPFFDRVTELEDCIEIEWQGEIGYLPKEFFVALAQYVNQVDAIRAYVDTLNQENLPP